MTDSHMQTKETTSATKQESQDLDASILAEVLVYSVVAIVLLTLSFGLPVALTLFLAP